MIKKMQYIYETTDENGDKVSKQSYTSNCEQTMKVNDIFEMFEKIEGND
jgi:hypothetical protein